jgi:hypothetical protein
MFFAKRTQFQSMFTEETEKIQSQFKANSKPIKAISNPKKANLNPIQSHFLTP